MKKILIAGALMLSAGFITNQVHAQAVTVQYSNIQSEDQLNAKDFNSMIQAFQKTDDKATSAKALEQAQEYMRIGIATSKAAIGEANQSGNDKAVASAEKIQQKRAGLYNKLIVANRNPEVKKGEIVELLKMYSETL